MSTFDDRERSYEAKFALDEELRFKAEVRRNRLLGEWAAGLLGKSGDEAASYVKSVIASDFEEPGDDDILRKLTADLAGISDADAIRAKMAELTPIARKQLIDEM